MLVIFIVLELFSRVASNFQEVAASIFPLSYFYFLLLRLCNAQLRASKQTDAMIRNLLFTNYCLFHRAKNKLFTVLLLYSRDLRKCSK